VRRRLARAARGRQLGQQQARLLAIAGGGALEQVQRRRRGAEVALAQARAQGGACNKPETRTASSSIRLIGFASDDTRCSRVGWSSAYISD